MRVDMVQDWKIELRKRLSGKMKGQTYKVFISPDGGKYYSLAKAKTDGGFNPGSMTVDGRRRQQKKPEKQ